MVFQLILPLEHHVLVVTFGLLTGVVRLLEVPFQVLIAIIINVGVLLVTKVAEHVVFLQMLEEGIVVEEVDFTELHVNCSPTEQYGW